MKIPKRPSWRPLLRGPSLERRRIMKKKRPPQELKLKK
jgi:hypothetical protein